MIRQLAVLTALLAASAAPGADRPVPFLPQDQLPKNVVLHPAGHLLPEAVVEAAGTVVGPSRVLEIADPQVPSHLYVLRGKVKYESVDPPGYVEMWSHFPGGAAYFSRTLADVGPMAKIQGTHDWRDVALPFQSKPGLLPEKLVVNIVLPGRGKAYLGELTLAAWEGATVADGSWWTEQQAGWIGALTGSGVGMVGALVGTLCGLGIGRKLVQVLCVAVIAFSGVCLVAGVAALTVTQPYHVYFPLLLVGIIGVTVFGCNLPMIRKRYDAVELRKMSALDA